MIDPSELELDYQKYVQNLPEYVPDGIVRVDLELLQELDLLSTGETLETDLTHHFYVVESTEKLTLFNQKFAVWIVPQIIDEGPATYTLIALNRPHARRLEMVFETTGVYNHSNLVLKILEKFLDQIEENEKELFRFSQE